MRYYALSLFFLFVLLVLNIYNFMSTDTWGLMAKSQTDSTKIEDRIADMINEHNADPTAHMADDQSIGIHRVNDVLDHPQGSVVTDKKQFNQVSVEFLFEDISYWTNAAYYLLKTSPGVVIGTSAVTNNNSSLYKEEDELFGGNSFQKNLLWQISVLTDSGNSGDYSFGIGMRDGDGDGGGLRFSINNLALSGEFWNGATNYVVGLGTWVPGKVYTLRAFANYSSQKLEFWVDGVLGGEIDLTAIVNEDFTLFPLFECTKKRTAYQALIKVFTMLTSRDI